MPLRDSSLFRPQVLIALPPLTGIALLVIYVLVESGRPGTFTAPRPANIPAAIVAGNGPMALELMAQGADVNAAAPIRFALLGPGEHQVTPLEAAVLSQRPEVVRLLLRTGAERTRSRRAVCLARIRLPEVLPLLGVSDAERDARPPAACLA
jgi:hypothetical protein